MNAFANFLRVRELILFGSKIVAIIFCIYYIINAKNYKVSWSLFDWLMPNYVVSLNKLLSYIGAYILVVPLTIILGSLLIPESFKLHMLSSLFGITSILITTIKNLRGESLTEISNFRFFTVSHILSLQDKRDIFITEYNRIATEQYLHIIKVYNYLMTKLNQDLPITHDAALENLNLPSQIKLYSQKVLTGYITVLSENADKGYHLSAIPWKAIIIVIGGIICLCITAAIVNKVITDVVPVIKEMLVENKMSYAASQKTVEMLTELNKTVSIINQNTKDIAFATININQRVDQHSTAISYVTHGILAYLAGNKSEFKTAIKKVRAIIDKFITE